MRENSEKIAFLCVYSPHHLVLPLIITHHIMNQTFAKYLKPAIIIGIIVVLVAWAWSSYNGLVGYDEKVKESWAGVQSAYQRRSDLIPNLVSTVKGNANFEKQTLTQVIEARAKASQIRMNTDQLDEQNIRKFQAAQGQLSQALGRLMVLTENYPQLRATEAFRDLQTQLEGTENRIKIARDDFNKAVKSYNVRVRRFPSNFMARFSGFTPKQPFQADETASQAPQVQF